MKILYFGTVCELKTYEQRLNGCNSKPSVAPIVFEISLLDGFSKNGADIEIHSFPMIPTFPNSKLLHFGRLVEKLSCGYTCHWLNTINLPVLKQLSRKFDARKIMKRWLKEHRQDGMILTYSIPPFLVKDILKYAKKYGVKTVAIVTDLLRDMYINEQKPLIKKIKNLYLSPALHLQGDYDGYVYLTEAMCKVVAPQKPYVVMEGIADTSNIIPPDEREKSSPRAIMYAGMLYEKYGIINLLDSFELIKDRDVQLWLFGDGTAVPEIKRRAVTDNRIKYFGMVSHDKILEYERKAILLVNPRDADEDFTEYSFPSKTIEYMLSGTPVVTTRLKGIPQEYFDYVFPAESNRVSDLIKSLSNALTYSKADMNAFGVRAQRFIINNKNSVSQSARILAFLEEVQNETKT